MLNLKPEQEIKLHAFLAGSWFVAAFPIMLTNLRNSVALLVFISVYANVGAHWGAAQAARAEKEAKSESVNVS